MTLPELPKILTATSTDFDMDKFGVARTVEPLYEGYVLPDNLVTLYIGQFVIDADVLFGRAAIQNALRRGEQVVVSLHPTNEHYFGQLVNG